MLQCSSAPVVFLLGSFFPSAFYAEIQGARAPEQLVLSQDPAVGFFWVTGTLTNSRLMLDEKYNLHCWLSPVTDTWQGFGWNFVLKILAWKLILHFGYSWKSRASSPCSPVCVNKQEHLLKKIPMSTIFLRLSEAANRGTSGSHGIFFLMHSEFHTQRCTRSAHICSHFSAGL